MKSPEPRAASFMTTNASPRVLFLAGALLFPAFLLQQDIAIRALQIALFMVLNAISGKRIRFLQYFIVAAGIVVFNLVIPTGRVLLSVIGLPITEGALKSGLLKATAMTGLIALSQFSIRSDLRLPGRIGGLIGQSLFYFEKIMGERRRIERKDIIGSIDTVLLEIYSAGIVEKSATKTRAHSTLPGLAVLSSVVLINWGAYIFTLFQPRPIWGG
jgi:heptaprenyl diphosphate synthase